MRPAARSDDIWSPRRATSRMSVEMAISRATGTSRMYGPRLVAKRVECVTHPTSERHKEPTRVTARVLLRMAPEARRSRIIACPLGMFLLLAEPFEQFAIVLQGHAVEDARVDERLQVHTSERVLVKRVV